MTATTRRSVLTLLAAGAAGAAGTVLAGPAPAAAADPYPSNTALYAARHLKEGIDYGRRHRRHDSFDDNSDEHVSFPQTAVIAPHGGGIEVGTSELCLAVAGYHPATLAAFPVGGPRYDYWMFEGLRPRDSNPGNDELHVTSTHCDDPVAESLCGGARQAVALHGCSTDTAGVGKNDAVVLVGGLDQLFKKHLIDAFAEVGIATLDAATHKFLSGTDPANIVNRTVLRRGAQLELTAPLRDSMFLLHTAEDRKHSTTDTFWDFVRATRSAIARIPANRPRT
jgi:phage replication-related protein YjqB (UPF0714/DUF867 family)